MRFDRMMTAMITLAITASAQGAIVDPSIYGLTGDTSYDAWTNLSKQAVEAAAGVTFPGHPGTGDWPVPIASQDGTGGAVLEKVSSGTGFRAGGPYPASGSANPYPGTSSNGRIYFGGTGTQATATNSHGGTLGVHAADPRADLASIVFQVEIGEVWGYDFFDNVLPALSFNGGSQSLAPTAAYIVDQVQVGVFNGDEPVYVNTHVMQWDVTGLGAITDFEIVFAAVQHSQLYGLRLDQSNVMSAIAVPEASTLFLTTIGIAAVGVVARRRKSA